MLEVEVGELYVLRGRVYKVLEISTSNNLISLRDVELGGLQMIDLISFGLEAEAYELEPEMEVVFEPETEMIFINGEYELVGYSEQSREDLFDFIRANRETGFTIKDINGIPNAVLSSQFLKASTLILTDL